jgi:hypothetical protein
VKCATSHRNTRCSARAAGSGELYTLDDLDFLAAYVIKKDLWYVVPADAFIPPRSHTPNPHVSQNQRDMGHPSHFVSYS